MNSKDRHLDVDALLARALYSAETPGAELIEKVKYPFAKEEPILKKSIAMRSFGAAAAAIALLLLVTTSALAAWHFLKPSQVAEDLGKHALSAAFEGESAVNINASVTSGEYIFTLLAVVSGAELTDMPYGGPDVRVERTYAVAAIQRADGTPMPSTRDEDYAKVSFFASPLIKGKEPWLYNAVTMHGGYFDTVVDGVLYRVVACDSVAAFADSGLYFAICSDAFVHNGTFLFDRQTGEISVNPDYAGASAVFDLPLDKALSDPEKAEQYLDELFSQPAQTAQTSPPASGLWEGIDWEVAQPVDTTVQQLSMGANGEVTFTYDFEHGAGTITVDAHDYFTENHTAQSAIVHQIASGDTLYAIRLCMDEDGVITGMVVMPN